MGVRGFLNYFRYEQENHQYVSESDNLSLSLSTPLWKGDLTVNATYNSDDRGRDSTSVGLSWRKTFGSDYSGHVGVNVDDEGYAYSQANVSRQFTGEDWNGTARIGIKHYDHQNAIGEGSVSVSGHNDSLRYNAYSFADTEGYYSLSGNVSGTQILSSQGGTLTNQSGTTFIGLSPKWDSEDAQQDELDVNYSTLKNDRSWKKEAVKVGKLELLTLQPYNKVGVQLDVESKNIDADQEEIEFFARPGVYYQVNNAITALVSQTFILNDMNGQPITHARCIGDGCKSVEALSDDEGVFRVNYRNDKPFKLISDKRLCVYNPDSMGSRYVQAYCLPGLENAEGELVRQKDLDTIAKVDIEQALIYIGKYETNEDMHQILSRLSEVGLVWKNIEIGMVQYLYVQYKDNYTLAQRTLLESLDAYVILDTIDKKQLFTSRGDYEKEANI